MEKGRRPWGGLLPIFLQIYILITIALIIAQEQLQDKPFFDIFRHLRLHLDPSLED